jgi:hypothetical protein
MRAAILSSLLLFVACRSEESSVRPVRPAGIANAVQLTSAASAAWQRWTHAERFADSMVGDDGVLPPEAFDLRTIVREDTSGNACAELFRTATMGGRSDGPGCRSALPPRWWP